MSKFGLRYQCARGALACAMALTPAIAHAQDAGAANTEEADLIDAADVDSGNVIIVRAQGREQALADVPVAVSAVSGELLEKSGVADIRDLNQVAPSLLISSTGNEANGSARIRGIGTVGDNPGLESSVAVFVDGVYRSRSGNAMAELGPLDRVEILFEAGRYRASLGPDPRRFLACQGRENRFVAIVSQFRIETGLVSAREENDVRLPIRRLIHA